MECYYFGCESKAESGHYLFAPGMRSVNTKALPRDWPFEYGELDGKYAAQGRRKDHEGIARLVHVRGWTVLAMWDRSADSRHNSNAAFAARGEREYAEMVGLAATHFPAVWKRINDRKAVRPLDAVKDEKVLIDMSRAFAAMLADVRGRRGRDFVRAMPHGDLLDLFDSKAEGLR